MTLTSRSCGCLWTPTNRDLRTGQFAVASIIKQCIPLGDCYGALALVDTVVQHVN
jgi:hypothetical protein